MPAAKNRSENWLCFWLSRKLHYHLRRSDAFLIGMCSKNYLDAHVFFQGHLQIIKINWATSHLHRRFHSGAEVKDLDGPTEVFGGFIEHLDLRHGQAGTITAIGHGN